MKRVISKRDGSVRYVMEEGAQGGRCGCGSPYVCFAKNADAPRSEWTLWTAQSFRRVFQEIAA